MQKENQFKLGDALESAHVDLFNASEGLILVPVITKPLPSEQLSTDGVMRDFFILNPNYTEGQIKQIKDFLQTLGN